jgi:hypothetical protein
MPGMLGIASFGRSPAHAVATAWTMVAFTGCLLLNDVNVVSSERYHRLVPSIGRALVVFGVGVEGRRTAPRFQALWTNTTLRPSQL